VDKAPRRHGRPVLLTATRHRLPVHLAAIGPPVSAVDAEGHVPSSGSPATTRTGRAPASPADGGCRTARNRRPQPRGKASPLEQLTF
jgi:hypothetical protein